MNLLNLILRGLMGCLKVHKEGIWEYVKLPNGLAICWGKDRPSVEFAQSGYIGGYVSEAISAALPITLIEKPVAFVSANSEQQSVVGWVIAEKQAVLCKLYNSSSGTVKTDLNYHVIGRWK